MKRLVSAFLAGAMALSLAACGGAASTSTVASSASASGSAAASETAASDLDYIKGKGKMVIRFHRRFCIFCRVRQHRRSTERPGRDQGQGQDGHWLHRL